MRFSFFKHKKNNFTFYHGDTVVASWTADNRSSDPSCTRGMRHNKIHLINPGCPWSSIALQVQNRVLKTFISFLSCPISQAKRLLSIIVWYCAFFSCRIHVNHHVTLHVGKPTHICYFANKSTQSEYLDAEYFSDNESRKVSTITRIWKFEYFTS